MYHVHYLRTEASLPYEDSSEMADLLRVTHSTGEVTIDCGTTACIEEFIEGVNPGVYLFTPVNPHNTDILSFHETFPVPVGVPYVPQDIERIVADAYVPEMTPVRSNVVPLRGPRHYPRGDPA